MAHDMNRSSEEENYDDKGEGAVRTSVQSTVERSDRLMSDFALTKRQSRSLYRNWAVVSRKSAGNCLQPQMQVFSKISTSSISNDCTDCNRGSSGALIEDRADEIVRHMEKSHSLMVDNIKSNNSRIETLREMTEYLTVKRSVKKKLMKSMSFTNNSLDLSKRVKYKLSFSLIQLQLTHLGLRASAFLDCALIIKCFNDDFITFGGALCAQKPCITKTSNSIPVALKHFFGSFELWYSSLKVIEGHFGSNVASYFKFLRKLFLLNACIFILMFFFVMIPQLLFRFIQYVDDSEDFYSRLENNSFHNERNISFLLEEQAAPLIMLKANPYKENDAFRLGNIFTGEGFLTNTILFYGHYTNTSLQLIQGYSYSIPASYFFTSIVSYVIIFFFLFTSVAVSYRKCYIETSGGMHNTFSNKLLCGWDFGIATEQAAELKSKSIYIEIKELLNDLSMPTKRKTCANTLYTTVISLSLNGLLLFLLVVGGMYSWKYLDQQMNKADTATTMMMWLILTLVIAVAPVLFSFISHIEGFESPSTALYMTLIRTFTLYAVVIAVVVAYRLNRSGESECWETILGQDMFRLVVLDFIFGTIGTALSEFIRYRIFITMWPGIGCPEFDIARSTMNLVYNQTLFYLGLFFSPVLSLLITIKLFIIFYVKKWGAVYNCRPFIKPWKASQAYTVYLSIAFLAFFCVIIAFGYIITSVKTSNCGPFRGEKFMYENILKEILAHENSTILTVFYYITRPGVVGIVLIAMVLGVYYMRAVALARIHVVKHLRHLLRLKAEDRKLLLNEISKYTKPHDSPDASSGNMHKSRIRTSSLNSSKSRDSLPEDVRLKKQFNSSSFKKRKFSFSLMNNVQKDNEILKRNIMDSNSMFCSSPNISTSYAKENKELSFKFNETNKQEDEDGAENVNRQPHSEFEGNFESSVTKVSEIPDENQERDFHRATQLNFNPVFTESAVFYSDEEEGGEYVDDNNERVIRASILSSGKELEMNENDNVNAGSSFMRHLNMEEERMPSRISFTLEKKKCGKKKKK